MSADLVSADFPLSLFFCPGSCVTVCSSAVFFILFFFWPPKKSYTRHPRKGTTPQHPKTMASDREDGDGDVGGNDEGAGGRASVSVGPSPSPPGDRPPRRRPPDLRTNYECCGIDVFENDAPKRRVVGRGDDDSPPAAAAAVVVVEDDEVDDDENNTRRSGVPLARRAVRDCRAKEEEEELPIDPSRLFGAGDDAAGSSSGIIASIS